MNQITQRITGTLGLALLTCTVLGSSPVKAEAPYTPVLEYNGMSLDEKFTIVEEALSKIYTYYSKTNPNLDTANCIIDLFTNPDREITGYDHLGVAVQVALTNPDVELISVEKILLGIVNSQCRLQANEQKPNGHRADR